MIVTTDSSNNSPQTDSKSAGYTMRLVGPFGLFRQEGAPVNIPHLKNQALLVLLVSTPRQERSRRWIEATLWSDRGPNEAKQSLRTALSELRRAFKSKDGVIASNRNSVWIVPGTITVDLDHQPPFASDPDILEGLDIQDEAFNDWLTFFRAEQNNKRVASDYLHGTPPAGQIGLVLLSKVASGSSRFEEFVAQALLDYVDQNLTETIDFGFGAAPADAAVCLGGILVRSTVIDHEGQSRLSVRLEDAATGTRLWHSNSTMPSHTSELERHPELLKAAFGTSSAVMDKIRAANERMEPSQASTQANLSRAIVDMFSFEASRLRIAEALLDTALNDLSPPVRSTWQSLCYQFIYAEGLTNNPTGMRARALSASEEAVYEAPDNSQTLAIASCVRQLLGESPDVGLALARRAIELNASNAFAYVGYGFALLRQGAVAKASAAFERAERLASRSVYLHWVQMFSCLCAIATQDFDLATLRAQASSAKAPNFRSALRHLYALKLYNEDQMGAQSALSRLDLVEPGFSMEMVRSNPSYPVSIIRNSPLIALKDLH